MPLCKFVLGDVIRFQCQSFCHYNGITVTVLQKKLLHNEYV